MQSHVTAFKLVSPGLNQFVIMTRPARLAFVMFSAFLAACGVVRQQQPSVPDEEARHRAALTNLVVDNRTTFRLTIAYRTPTPPVQEVVLGPSDPGMRRSVAPIPAGEPLVLVARRDDGAELALAPRSYPIDSEWIWEIAANAQFKKP